MRDICLSLVCTFTGTGSVKRMIIAGITAAAVGLVQFFLDTVLFGSVFANKAAKGIFSLLGKLLIYTVAFILLFKLFRTLVKAAAVGFAIGFFPCLFIYCIYKIKKAS